MFSTFNYFRVFVLLKMLSIQTYTIKLVFCDLIIRIDFLPKFLHYINNHERLYYYLRKNYYITLKHFEHERLNSILD